MTSTLPNCLTIFRSWTLAIGAKTNRRKHYQREPHCATEGTEETKKQERTTEERRERRFPKGNRLASERNSDTNDYQRFQTPSPPFLCGSFLSALSRNLCYLKKSKLPQTCRVWADEDWQQSSPGCDPGSLKRGDGRSRNPSVFPALMSEAEKTKEYLS